MDKTKKHGSIAAPLGSIEPHANLLNVPPDTQLLYKMMTTENLLRSIVGSYLYFHRVDSYKDFPDADPHDGQQLPKDQQGNEAARFAKAPNFSMADYYNQSRARTFACCFSVENSDLIWQKYANDSERGKVCVVFNFGKLRSLLNQTLQPGNSVPEYCGDQCRQIFSINYGIIGYIEWDQFQANAKHLVNPIEYTFWKGKQYSGENELRIALSALGIGNFAMNDGRMMDFPDNVQVVFDFRAAIMAGAIQQILYAPDCDSGFLHAELRELCIVAE